MKILFLTHYVDMYGANRALLGLLTGLKNDGKHTPILVLPAEGEFSRRLSQLGIAIYICPVTQWQAVYRGALRFAVKSAIRCRAIKREVEQLYQRFRDEEIGLIHSNSSVIGSGAMLAERLGCKHIWHIREFSEEHYGMRYFFNKSKVRQLYEQAWRLVCISDALKENYERRYPAARICRIYDGVSLPQAYPARQTHKEIVFVYAGYLFPKKGQLALIKAFHKMKEQTETGFRLILAGTGDKAYSKKLRDYVRKNRLDFVEFAGFVEDMPALLTRCDVGVIASEYEGFGLVSVEYMLYALPVLGRRSGATPELVEDGVNGLLYEDEASCISAALRLLHDEALRRDMGRAGERLARERFLSGRNAEEIRKLYEEMA